jgi:hypothetical protein
VNDDCPKVQRRAVPGRRVHSARPT